jgi:monofunctional biosynthetic peptidoglycan transglycosylase
MPKARRCRILRRTFFVILAAIVLGLGYNLAFPDISRFKKEAPQTTAFMKHRQKMARRAGKNLAIDTTWMPLDKISPYLVQAVVISEDDKFWGHKGFDLSRPPAWPSFSPALEGTILWAA